MFPTTQLLYIHVLIFLAFTQETFFLRLLPCSAQPQSLPIDLTSSDRNTSDRTTSDAAPGRWSGRKKERETKIDLGRKGTEKAPKKKTQENNNTPYSQTTNN